MTPFVSRRVSRRKSASRLSKPATNEGFALARVAELRSGNQGFDFSEGGWAVEWRTFTASMVESPGAEAKQIGGTGRPRSADQLADRTNRDTERARGAACVSKCILRGRRGAVDR